MEEAERNPAEEEEEAADVTHRAAIASSKSVRIAAEFKKWSTIKVDGDGRKKSKIKVGADTAFSAQASRVSLVCGLCFSPRGIFGTWVKFEALEQSNWCQLMMVIL